MLEALHRSDRPLTVTELAEVVGLHPNTVRAHLALLTEYGYAQGRTEERTRPGRPRLLYSATQTARGQRDHDERNRGDYRMLAEALAAYVAESGGQAGAAATAGRAYGRRLARHVRSPKRQPYTAGTGDPRDNTVDRRRDPEDTVDGTRETAAVVRMLDDAGFDPQLDANRLLLRNCPFRDLAETDSIVVCGVHLGLMQGALAELDAPVEVTRLEPFVEPRLCVATLGPRQPPPARKEFP